MVTVVKVCIEVAPSGTIKTPPKMMSWWLTFVVLSSVGILVCLLVCFCFLVIRLLFKKKESTEFKKIPIKKRPMEPVDSEEEEEVVRRLPYGQV